MDQYRRYLRISNNRMGWSGGIHRRQNKPLMAGARAKTPDGFKPKDLMLIGAQMAIALQKDGWFLRNEIIWHKKGVRPENVSDRFTRTHEKVYLFTKAGSYWFDQDEVREPLVTKPPAMQDQRAKRCHDECCALETASEFGRRIL